jgi:hypothetical protein
MLRSSDIIEVRCNFTAYCRERGKRVPGTSRDGHNVFTTVGRDWLAHLAAWSQIGGGGDVPYTNRRVRWMAVGTGTQAEVEGVIGMTTPVEATAGNHLAAIETTDFPLTTSVRFFKEFATNEISFGASPVVGITEAGLFVDVFDVNAFNVAIGSADDDAYPSGNTTLNPASPTNAPVAYKTFEVITKTADFSLVIEWTFIF